MCGIVDEAIKCRSILATQGLVEHIMWDIQ